MTGADGDTFAAVMERAAARNQDAAERNMEAVAELSAAAGRLMAYSSSPTGTGASSAITINGSGAVALILAVVGIVAVVTAVAAVLIVQAGRAADMRAMDEIRSRVEKVETAADVNRVYLETLARRLPQE